MSSWPVMAGDLLVSAAASLNGAFKEVAQAYEAQHPGVRVRLNFAASGALLQQMDKGAPVDVFASADQETMDAAVAKGLVRSDERRNFARNGLVLIAPRDQNVSLSHLADLSSPHIKRIALGQPASVPAGRYAQAALQSQSMWGNLQPRFIFTQNVRQTLDYVARGEVDVGFVYVTDAMSARDKVKVIGAVPVNHSMTYPLAVTKMAVANVREREAKRFVAYVLSPDGQAVLAQHGFMKP